MGKVMILNGSPRAPRSNSRRYAELFAAACPAETAYFAITRSNHSELCQAMEGYSDVLLTFPLYADGIPVTLLNFLKSLEQMPPVHRPTVSVLINCGFLEPEQNDVAVDMLRLYCRENGYSFGSVLKMGSGEAILSTPFRFLAHRKIRALARAVAGHTPQCLTVTMPLPKRLFIRASTSYWTAYGRKNGISPEQMAHMGIEE